MLFQATLKEKLLQLWRWTVEIGSWPAMLFTIKELSLYLYRMNFVLHVSFALEAVCLLHQAKTATKPPRTKRRFHKIMNRTDQLLKWDTRLIGLSYHGRKSSHIETNCSQ